MFHESRRRSVIQVPEGCNAAILAGGLGLRLQPAYAVGPKPMAPVDGKPFLIRLIRQAAEAGVRRVVLCVGYRADVVEEGLGRMFQGVEIVYSRETEPRGTGGALRLALSKLRGEEFFVLNGDSYYGIELAEFHHSHQASGCSGAVALVHRDDCRRFGRVEVGSNGLVVKFVEKDKQAVHGWVNAGVYVLSRKLVEGIPEKRFISLERDLFPRWIRRGLLGYKADGPFLDIGTPASYAVAGAFFRQMVRPASPANHSKPLVKPAGRPVAKLHAKPPSKTRPAARQSRQAKALARQRVKSAGKRLGKLAKGQRTKR